MEWSRANSVREDAFCPRLCRDCGTQSCGAWAKAAEAENASVRKKIRASFTTDLEEEGITDAVPLRHRATRIQPRPQRLVAAHTTYNFGHPGAPKLDF